jgi:DNA-directed RNA polymerase subunit RPC12/RpoP
MSKHYNCGGQLVETEQQSYRCRSCGRLVRASVIDRDGSFKRVAENDSALSEIARAALEGVYHD